MGVIRPRPPASQSLTSDRSANLADRQQIRRLLSTVPQPKKQAASSAVGQTIAVPTESVVIGTGGSLEVLAWEFLTEGPDGTSPGLIAPDAGWNPNGFGFADDGWYEADILVDIGWALGAPSRVFVSAGRAAIGFLSQQFRFEEATVAGGDSVHSPGIVGCYRTLHIGPQYYAAEQQMTVGISWPNTATPTSCSGFGGPQFRVDVTRVG